MGWARSAQYLDQLQKMELKAREWVYAAPGAAKCSLSMASWVAQLCWYCSLLLFTRATLCLTYHQCAYPQSKTDVLAMLVCLHASAHWTLTS